MGDKQMEGDNQRRRALAREARQAGQRPSEAGVTLGSSKQREHVKHSRRDGPAAVGGHKPEPGSEHPARPPEPPEQQWPTTSEDERRPEPDEGAGPRLRYRELVAEIAYLAGTGFDEARESARAVIATATRVLTDRDRQRLLDALPLELHEPAVRDNQPTDVGSFLAEVVDLSGMPPERARYRTQAVLSVLRAQSPVLADALDLPAAMRDLMTAPPVGGGVLGPGGHLTPLSDEELANALRRLPYWSGTRHGLRREVILPPPAAELVLRRLAQLRIRLGRGPRVARPAPDTIMLVVRTNHTHSVTRLDVDLAHAIDDTIEAAGAGMSG
jgi:hypothetical protein